MGNQERLPVLRTRIGELMGARSITEFAKELQISRQTLGFYLNGDRIPDSETLAQICRCCNVSADWLLGLSEDPNAVMVAADEFGLSEEAARRLQALRAISQIPPEKGQYSRINLLSDLLEDEDFTGWFLANCTQYVKRKQRTSSEDYGFTTEYAAIISELEKHGFEIATSESVAQRLFSENIIPKLRNMLDRLAKKKSLLDPAHVVDVLHEELANEAEPEAN